MFYISIWRQAPAKIGLVTPADVISEGGKEWMS